MILHVIFGVILFGCSGLAFWVGRDSERITAATLLACAIVSPWLQSSNFIHPELGILMIDLLLLAYLVWLALRSDRFWPMYAAAFQFVGTLIHVARLVDSAVWPAAYATAQVFWSYPVLFALGLGTWLEARYRDA